jgi:tetratricopeptide (TPR) repeat protein
MYLFAVVRLEGYLFNMNEVHLFRSEEMSVVEGKESGSLSKHDALLNKADLLALEGYQLAYEGKYEEAIDRYDKAISILPLNPDIWAFKAIVLSGGLNRNEEALECWEQVKKLDSVLADAITYTNTENLEINLKENVADRIRNLVKQQALNR